MIHDTTSTRTRIERRVLPARQTLVTVKLVPESSAFLYHPDSPESRIQLDADDRGIVRFHVRLSFVGASTVVHLERHAADGRIELNEVSIICDARYTRSMSAPELETEAAVVGELRKPLEGDPMEPSNAELIARGFPPRPDPLKSPAQYACAMAEHCFAILHLSQPAQGGASRAHPQTT